MNAGCVRNSDVRTSAGRDRASVAPRPHVDRRRYRTRPSTAFDDRGRRGLVERDAERVGVDEAQVDRAARPRPRRSRRRDPGTRTVSVSKKCSCTTSTPPRRSAAASPAASRCTRRAIARRPSAPWYDGVQTGDHREQDLRGADVARRLLAPDVLLARLQREPERGAALRVDRHADEAAGQRAPVLVAHREVRGVRSAEAERHPEALRRADDHVGAHLARRRHEREREQVGRDAHQRAVRVRALDRGREVAQPTAAPRVLHEHAETPVDRVRRCVGIADDDLDAERLGARAHDVDRLRMRVGVDEEDHPRLRVEAVQHRHRLGRGGALVEQRRVGEIHAGEVAHHRLEVQQRLEPALADLGLVRRVRRVPRRVLEHVAQDHRRRDRVVVAEPDQRREHLVAAGELAQPGERVGLRQRLGQRERRGLADHGRDRGVDELVERAVAQRRRASSPGRRAGGRCAGRRTRPRRDLRWPAGRAWRETSRSASWVRAAHGPTPPLSRNSRVASLRRFGCLRDSGEWLLLRRPDRSKRASGLSRQRSTAMSTPR